MDTFIGYYYFMQIFMPICMTLNCTLTTVPVIMLAACSKWGKRERPLLSGHRWYVSNWISIPIQVSNADDDWLALSWLVNVGWSLILARLSPHTTNVQYSSSFCKGASGVFHTVGYNTVIFAVSKAWLMSSLHCVLNWEVFCIDFCCF